MSAHTPGPWAVDDEANVCANNAVVAVTSDMDDWGTRYANAVLIAAAPDLLAATDDMVKILNDFRGSSDFDARLDEWMRRYALLPDKAEGRT